jgi:hypothetical protein
MKGNNIWRRFQKLADIDFKLQLLFIVVLALLGLIYAIAEKF